MSSRPYMPLYKADDLVQLKGETKTFREWATIHKLKINTVMNRVNQLGWSPEKALTHHVMSPSVSGRKANSPWRKGMLNY